MSNSVTVVTEHFTHPGHKLVQLESNKEYLCGCCKTLGSGKTFQCSSCDDFNMHEFCGKCPEQLSSLHVYAPSPPLKSSVCTQLPQNLRHALHVEHPLVLQKSTLDAPCCVCKDVCKSWRYRCGECGGFDIHLDCVLVVVSSTTTRNIQFAPPYTLQTPPEAPLHCGWVPPGYSSPYPPQPPLHGGWMPPGYSSPYSPQPPLHGGWVPPGYYTPCHNMHNSGFVNNQAYTYNPLYHHRPGHAQANYIYNPAFSMFNSTYYNPCGCGNCKPQAYNNPCAGTPLGSDPYNNYSNENQDHHVGSSDETQNCANHDHHQGVGSNVKVSRCRRMFKLVGQLTIGVLSSVIFGVTFPDLR
ncbi:hypothetical protein POM88_041003 [Heracleum sosnowskyi]|uniref:DC1 domain-containing protein n=1 Tax=Heracleum sosnowskyi TaxID=360622 RepID=A0AAD8HFY7_9APIA|nr:hypothetical protein POM88_041003 [Heracleum sosnowskyi]